MSANIIEEYRHINIGEDRSKFRSDLMEEYKRLADKCEQVLEKIKTRKQKSLDAAQRPRE